MPEGESAVREAAFRYRAILRNYLTSDLLADYYVAYRRYYDLWSNEKVWMPDRLFRALDAGHTELYEFAPGDDDPHVLRRRLETILAEIDAALPGSE